MEVRYTNLNTQPLSLYRGIFLAKAKQDVFKIKGGYLTGKKVSVQEVEALAKLPSRDQLLSMLLNSMLGPIRKLAYATVAIADKKEGSAE